MREWIAAAALMVTGCAAPLAPTGGDAVEDSARPARDSGAAEAAPDTAPQPWDTASRIDAEAPFDTRPPDPPPADSGATGGDACLAPAVAGSSTSTLCVPQSVACGLWCAPPHGYQCDGAPEPEMGTCVTVDAENYDGGSLFLYCCTENVCARYRGADSLCPPATPHAFDCGGSLPPPPGCAFSPGSTSFACCP